MRLERLAALALLSAAAGGCHRLSDDDAVALVRAYDRRVMEAFATSDPRRMEDVAGPEEAKKLMGLIGVKGDMGLVLHATMVAFAVEGVERSGDAITVRTRERWSYEERSATTGQRVGQPSDDSYEMRYHLARFDGRWKVARIAFAAPPKVGRSIAPVTAPPEVFHGTMPTRPTPGAPSPGVRP